MPLIHHSIYRPPNRLLRNGHANTIWVAMRRQVPQVEWQRERLELPDGDFLDLDWSREGTHRLLILLHGLEGSSNSGYMQGMAHAFNRKGWDAVAINFRGCSGEPNRLYRSYHSGATEDLQHVVEQVLALKRYHRLALVGFSLGGNLLLKWLGEQGGQVPRQAVAAAAVSAPTELGAAAGQMRHWSNRIYMQRFVKRLRTRLQQKQEMAPEKLTTDALKQMRNFQDVDGLYTAPAHGFGSAEEYWRECSANRFLSGIRLPTLLLNAADDPFLSPECYPVEQAREHPFLHLEVPEWGGHVGFATASPSGEYWHEELICGFVTDHALHHER